MTVPEAKSIAEVFALIKKKTGHKVDRVESDYIRGWLVFYGNCRYCGDKISIFTEDHSILINNVIVADYPTNKIRMNLRVINGFICKRLAVMK